MKTLHWEQEGGYNYVWLREETGFNWAGVKMKKPHTIEIWTGRFFVPQEMEYDNIDEAKAVAEALVAMR